MMNDDKDRKPYKPFRGPFHGPGAEYWREPDGNCDARTDHDALMNDVERRRRVGTFLVKAIREATENNGDLEKPVDGKDDR